MQHLNLADLPLVAISPDVEIESAFSELRESLADLAEIRSTSYDEGLPQPSLACYIRAFTRAALRITHAEFVRANS